MGSSPSNVVINEQLPNTRAKGFSSIYRKKNVPRLRETPDSSVQTLNDLIKHTVSKYGDKKGIGYVSVSVEKDERGEDVEVREMKEFTYREFYQMSFNLGRALVNRGLFSVENHHKMRLVGIFSKNRYEWLATDWACVLFGLTTVPLYDTLGVENISYCLNQTEMTTVFATLATIKTLLKLKDLGRLNTVISYDDIDIETENKLKELKIRVVLFSSLVMEGEGLKHITNNDVKVSHRSCYTFSYTSGTTGPPKGAMISHLNALSFVTGLHYENDLHFTSDDVYISYLPLPHVMERTIFSAMCYEGATFIVASGNILKLKDDCAIIKPTILMSVPRLYNKIVEGTKAKFEAQTGIKKCLIDYGINSKLQSAKEEGTYTNSFYDSIVFSKVNASFGGKIRILGSGSAPLSSEANMFMKAIMCAPLIQGYGQTESTAGFLFSRGLDTNYGVLASLAETCEVKLCEIPQMKYTADDRNEEGVSTPRGELWLRGSNVFMGYYKQEDLTRETITPDGWLKTGDIVEVNSQTLSFRLIDRRKNIFKLSQGEYVAPDKVENLYLGSQLITEVFVHGESAYHYAVAIATPNKEKLLKLAETKGINGSFEEICRDRQVRSLVLIELNNLGKKGGLHSFEQAKTIFLDPEGFAPKNILTNTMKLIRFEARKAYKSIVEQLYKQGELPSKE